MSERLISALNEIHNLPTITLGQIVDQIQEEALLILCLIAILPFMQPIPLPGLSSVLGLIIVLQGLGLIFLGRPLLTKRLREVVIARDKFDIIHKAAIKFTVITSRISILKHPAVNSRVSQVLCGVSIVFSAAFLSLPLPIPLSNFIPAMSIFLICVGLLEKDIFLVLVGHTITLGVVWMAIFSYQIIMEIFQR